MITKSIIYLGVLFYSVSIYSQKEVHIVKLNPEENSGIKGFIINEIIDNRLVKSNIGFAQKGLANRRVPAILPDSFQIYLLGVIQNIVPDSPNCQNLSAIIHEFNIAEQTKAMSELGTFRIQIEFAKKNNDKYLSVGYIEAQIDGKGMDVTNKHSKRILEGINYCLQEFSTSKWETKEGIEVDFGKSYELDFSNLPKKGLYSSYAKMCQNEPFLTEGYNIVEVKNKYPKFLIEDENGRKLKNRIMGFSDGKSIYLNASRYCYKSYFVKSIEIGRYIYFEDKFADPMAGVMFGLLGSAISTKAKPVLLDTKNGLVIVLDNAGMEKVLSEYPEIYQEYIKSKKRNKDRKEAIVRVNALSAN